MDEKKREDKALFRYGVIVPFLTSEQQEWGVKGELANRIAKEHYIIPGSSKTTIAESTIRRWRAAYLKKGFDGLKPRNRSDNGKSLVIDPKILETAFNLKKEEPKRSVRKIIKIMEAGQMAAPGLLKPSTLYRLLLKNGLTRKELKKTKKAFRHFQAEHANQIWQSDLMYGPALPDLENPGKAKKSYLVATLDDFSRLIPHAEFYWQEKLPVLENTLQKAILKRGIPEVLYVDNGKIFNARQIDTICAELGIRKINSKPYSPEGRGKIERFFRTVQMDFLPELAHDKVDHLHQLNAKFHAWLEIEYHQKIHSSTNQQPDILWRQNVTPFLRKIDEKELQSIFLWRESRKVSKTGLVSLEGLEFEVSSFLADKKVEIRYNPFNLDEIYIYFDGRFMQKAGLSKLSRWNTAKKQPDASPAEKAPETGVRHLQTLENQHQRIKAEQAKTLLGKQSNHDIAPFTQSRFIKAVADLLHRNIESLHQNEIKELELAWIKYGPFEPALLHPALAKAALQKGSGQHIAFYIEAIVNAHLNKSEKKG
jgi:putative transposase